MIKRVLAGSQETNILQHFSSSTLRQDNRNHCVPLLDVFNDSEDEDYNYIVEPVLRGFDEPGFFTVGEVVEFVRQMLEVRDRPLFFFNCKLFRAFFLTGFAIHARRGSCAPVRTNLYGCELLCL